MALLATAIENAFENGVSIATISKILESDFGDLTELLIESLQDESTVVTPRALQRFFRAALLASSGNTVAAIQEYETVFGINPSAVNENEFLAAYAYVHCGALMSLDDNERACMLQRTAIELFKRLGKRHWVHIACGLAYYVPQNEALMLLHEATESNAESVSSEPDVSRMLKFANAWFRYGCLLREMNEATGYGYLADAVICFNNVVAIQFDYPYAHRLLGDLLDDGKWPIMNSEKVLSNSKFLFACSSVS
jgi:tetratricopeptide (TPR) repeat protein